MLLEFVILPGRLATILCNRRTSRIVSCLYGLPRSGSRRHMDGRDTRILRHFVGISRVDTIAAPRAGPGTRAGLT